MAKRKPTSTLQEMEKELGYNLSDTTVVKDGTEYFYTDLRPVPDSVFERTQREVEERRKQRSIGSNTCTFDENMVNVGHPKRFKYEQNVVTLEHIGEVGVYTFVANTTTGFGLNFSFLLSCYEAKKVISAPK
ncbi:hypothetical protein LTR70_010037, partial [Exophiala xenobiotica]